MKSAGQSVTLTLRGATFVLSANVSTTFLALFAFQFVAFTTTGTSSLYTHIVGGTGIAATTDGTFRLTRGTGGGTILVNRTINRRGGGTTGIALHPGRNGIGTNTAPAHGGILTNDGSQIHAWLRYIRQCSDRTFITMTALLWNQTIAQTRFVCVSETAAISRDGDGQGRN